MLLRQLSYAISLSQEYKLVGEPLSGPTPPLHKGDLGDRSVEKISGE